MLDRFKKKLKQKLKHGDSEERPNIAHSDNEAATSFTTGSTDQLARYPSTSTLPAAQSPSAPHASGDGAHQPPIPASSSSAGNPNSNPLPLAGNDKEGGSNSQVATTGKRNPQLPSPPTTSRLPDAASHILDKSPSVPTSAGWMNDVFSGSLKMLKILAVLTGAPTLNSYVDTFEEKQAITGKQDLERYLDTLMKSIEPLTGEGGSDASQKLRDGLKGLYSSLSGISDRVRRGEDDEAFLERVAREITQTLDSFMLVNCISGIIKLTDILIQVQQHVLGQRIQNLPHVNAAYDDYKSKKKSGECFEGTREALLQEIAEWIALLSIAQIYLLSGIAGTGKSTVAYTIAERAKQGGYLGASFFFSRDEAARSNAEKFFTTIAFQLCLYDEEFAQAIEAVLSTREGAAAMTKDPEEQLKALILDPLRDILKSRSSPIVTVVDALDECDEEDAQVVLAGLNRLVQELPCFKVIVTTRPQPRLPPTLSPRKVFYLHDIEDKIIDGDIQRYLKHSLSWKQIKVILPTLEDEWSANDEEIEFLVQGAGRLFIMASTAVRFILDTKAYDPPLQMEVLKAEGRISLDSLEKFYNVILRCAVPLNQPTLAQRFRVLIGTILIAQEPLPIKILRELVHPWSSSAIKAVLANLQSVIMLNNDVPRIYHKSLFDFLSDPLHCAEDLLIDIKAHHTRVAIRCVQIMNRDLKRNALDLGAPAHFMDNDDGLEAANISAEQLAEKIPGELRYACIYWANHIEGAHAEDAGLTKELEGFVTEHLLHWLEALSWLNKLDVAYGAVRVLAKFMKLTSSHLRGIISDALRFIPRFSYQIRQSALHAYHSALPFTPTGSHLHKAYSKDMIHSLCRVEGVSIQWDALVTYFNQGFKGEHLVFSHDGSKFASKDQEEMWLWGAENGAHLRTYEGESAAIAHDFSVVAVSQDSAVTLWSVASNVPVATVTQSEKVVELALSFDGSRLAVGFSNGTVGLWDTGKGEWIACLEDYAGRLVFAPSGYIFAFISDDRTVRLWNGDDGNFVAKLDYESKRHATFAFSRDGRRLASLVTEANEDNTDDEGDDHNNGSENNNGSEDGQGDEGGDEDNKDNEDGDEDEDNKGDEGDEDNKVKEDNDGNEDDQGDQGNEVEVDGGKESDVDEDSEDNSEDQYSLTLWNGEEGIFIDVATNVGGKLAISEDGSLVATGGWKSVQLWSGEPLSLVDTVDVGGWIDCLAISRGILAIGSYDVTLYDINNRTVDATLQAFSPQSLVLSPNCTRLAVGSSVCGWLHDVPLLKASIPELKQQHKSIVDALIFSPDSLRLASGFEDGTVALWDTNHTERPLATHKLHSKKVVALAYSRAGERFASGSDDKTVRLWDGKDGVPMSKLEHLFTDTPTAMAFSDDLLAVATSDNITLFNQESLCPVNSFENGSNSLSFSADGSLLASASRDDDARDVTVWNVAERATIATFPVKSDVYKLTFSPDNSQLAAQSSDGDDIFELFDIVNEQSLKLTEGQDLTWVPNLMNDMLIAWKYDDVRRNLIVGRFSGCNEEIVVLRIAEEIDVRCFGFGSSMLAAGCFDSQILFIRFPVTTSVN